MLLVLVAVLGLSVGGCKKKAEPMSPVQQVEKTADEAKKTADDTAEKTADEAEKTAEDAGGAMPE